MASRGLKYSLRFLVMPGFKEQVSLKTVVVDVLTETFGIRMRDVLCLQDFPNQGIYDITFTSTAICWNIFEEAEKKKGEGALQFLQVIPLFMEEEKMLIVHMYNPFADPVLLRAFLDNYCDGLRGGEPVLNRYQIWTGKYRFFGRFKLDRDCIGGVRRPPPVFTVGGERGFLFYQGQPKYCRKCLTYGHTSNECEMTERCRLCQQMGHKAKDCKAGKVCDICKRAGHLAKQCPEYARERKKYFKTRMGWGEEKEQRGGQTGGAKQKAPEEGSRASETPGSAPSDVPPDDAAGVSGGVREPGGDAAAAADGAGYGSATPEMAEGTGGVHTGGPDIDVSSPREEEMDVGGLDGQPQDSSEGVEIVIEGAEQVASPASSPFVVSVLVGDISSSGEEEQEDMDDDEEEDNDTDGDSEESLECGQRMTVTPGSETQVAGKRTRMDKGGGRAGRKVPYTSIFLGPPRRRSPALLD